MPEEFVLLRPPTAKIGPAERATAADAVRRARRLADWLDNRFRIPGARRRIGLDALLGLAPGVGDAITMALSSYIIGEAWRLGLPKRALLRMSWNVLIDTAIGAVPLVGDLFDVAWRANQKNAALLAHHLETPAENTRRPA